LGIRINHFTTHQRKWFRGHTSAAVAKNNIPTEVWNQLFKFTIARNPFDRLVSLYYHLPTHTSGKEVRSMTFEQFVRKWSLDPKLQQKKLITDNAGHLLVDYVGHFESLATDFQYITSKIGIEETLPHRNGSSHRDYRTYYTPELIDLVFERFAADCEFFGYGFDVAQPSRRMNSDA
jgi:hypothetical protein